MKNIRILLLLSALLCQLAACAQIIIDVEKPAPGTDATRLLQRAIDKAATYRGRPTVIRLATTQYDISRTEATERLLHVSNTTSESENPVSLKHIGLHFRGLKNVTFDGGGARLLTHGEMTTFVIDSCENVTLQNFTLDADDPSLAEATVTEVGDDYAILRTARDTRYEIDADGRLYWTGHGWRFTGGIAQVFTPADNSSLRTASPMDGLKKAAELRPGLLWMHYDRRPGMKVGTTYQMRHSYRTEVCGCINRSKNVTLRDIEFNFLGNFGIVGQFSENLTYDHLRCAPAYESDRTGAGFADFVQMSGCRGKVRILNSYFEGAHDDPINVHGTHLKVKEWRGERQAVVRFMHGQTRGMIPFVKGDEVEAVSAHSLLALQSMKVATVERLDDYDWLLTFDRTISAKVKAEDNVAIENVTWTPEVEIRNNYFARIPTRGILVSTRRPVLIEQNVFFRMPMASILISDDARSWYESGPAHNVTIRHNKFVECSSPVLLLWPENDRHDGPIHRNITVTHNTFSFMDPANPVVVKARSVEGLTVKDNHYDTEVPAAQLFDLHDCTNVVAE